MVMFHVKENCNNTLILCIFFILANFEITDMFLNFFTAVKIDGVLVNKRKDIALSYLKGWFVIDFASSFPAEAFSEVFLGTGTTDCGQGVSLQLNKMLRLLRIFKLFRVFRLARILKRMEEITKFNPSFIRLVKLLFILVFIWHVIGCSYWYVSSLEDFAVHEIYFQRDEQNMWVPPPELWCTMNNNATQCTELNVCKKLNENDNELCPAPLRVQYVNCFFWAVMATTGMLSLSRKIQRLWGLNLIFIQVLFFTNSDEHNNINVAWVLTNCCSLTFSLQIL